MAKKRVLPFLHSSRNSSSAVKISASRPKKIAASLKRSAEHSHRRKGTPFQSAMSMLTFYLNRAGKNLPAKRKRTLEKAKDELRSLFGKRRSRAAHSRQTKSG